MARITLPLSAKKTKNKKKIIFFFKEKCSSAGQGVKKRTLTCSNDENVVGFTVGGAHLGVDGQFGELVLERRVSQQRQAVKGRHRFIHQRVRLDEIERHFRQGARIIDALARPRLWNFGRRHRQPIGVHRRLLFERAVERVEHVLQPKGANGRTENGVGRRGEDAVNQPLAPVTVRSFHDIARRFCWRKCTNTHYKVKFHLFFFTAISPSK